VFPDLRGLFAALFLEPRQQAFADEVRRLSRGDGRRECPDPRCGRDQELFQPVPTGAVSAADACVLGSFLDLFTRCVSHHYLLLVVLTILSTYPFGLGCNARTDGYTRLGTHHERGSRSGKQDRQSHRQGEADDR
jgi:hypothetical protein